MVRVHSTWLDIANAKFLLKARLLIPNLADAKPHQTATNSDKSKSINQNQIKQLAVFDRIFNHLICLLWTYIEYCVLSDWKLPWWPRIRAHFQMKSIIIWTEPLKSCAGQSEPNLNNPFAYFIFTERVYHCRFKSIER